MTHLETDLRAMLRRQADTAAFSEEPFDSTERLPIEADRPTAATRWPALAAAAVLLVAVAAATFLVRRVDGPATGEATPLRMVTALEDDDWVLPVASDGFELDFALVMSSSQKSASFTTPGSTTRTLNVGIWSGQEAPFPGGSSDIEIDGVTWKSGGQSAVQLARTLEDGRTVTISSSTISATDVHAIASRLIVVPEPLLPHPAVDVSAKDGWTEVARTETQFGTVVLQIKTDGTNYCVFTRSEYEPVSGGGGCGDELSGNLAFTSGSAQGPTPASVEGGATSQSLMYGLVRPDVQRLDVRLVDGRIITVTPQDLADSFPVNFYIVAIPTTTVDGFEQLDTITAYDAEGNVLGVATPF
jgi:hypothetical protein